MRSIRNFIHKKERCRSRTERNTGVKKVWMGSHGCKWHLLVFVVLAEEVVAIYVAPETYRLVHDDHTTPKVLLYCI